MRFYAIKVTEGLDDENIEYDDNFNITSIKNDLKMYCPKFKFLESTINYMDVFIFCSDFLGRFFSPWNANRSSREDLKSFIDLFEEKLEENPNPRFTYEKGNIHFNSEYIHLLYQYFKEVYYNGGVIVCEYDNEVTLEKGKYIEGQAYLVWTFDLLGNKVGYYCLLKVIDNGILHFIRTSPFVKSRLREFTVNVNYKHNEVQNISLCSDYDVDSMDLF